LYGIAAFDSQTNVVPQCRLKYLQLLFTACQPKIAKQKAGNTKNILIYKMLSYIIIFFLIFVLLLCT